MCGIIGYIGDKDAGPILYNGLKRMEYRGYDSVGVATIHDGELIVKKGVGKVTEITKELDFKNIRGKIGIAHTRWATHGGVTRENAHPHASCGFEVAVIHNGMIDNYLSLKENLKAEGHKFNSETDSEIIVHLLEKNYQENENEKQAMLKTISELKGAFAFLAIFKSNPKMIMGARKDAPLIIGIGEQKYFLASDVLAFIEWTNKVIFLDNREIGIVENGHFQVLTFEGKPINKKITQVAWEAKDTSKEAFTHYTAKEIHEQPQTIRAALSQDSDKLMKFCKAIEKTRNVHITACGTSYHAGLILSNLLARLVKKRSDIILSSEFTHYAELIERDGLVIAISQSGETADLLSAVSKAKEKGGEVFSILNSAGSSLDRVSNLSLYLNCGPEIGVAATKSFTAQLILIYLIVLSLTKDNKRLACISDISKSVKDVLRNEQKVSTIAEKYKECNDFYYVGRSLNLPIAMEGALKLKELAYNHAEGIAGGELKHGTLALIENGTPVVALNPDDGSYHEMLDNIFEMKARGAKIIGVSNKPHEIYDEFIPIPTIHEIFYPLVEVIPLQMLAYWTAVKRQRDPDYPRNLAKSVTVK